MNAGARQLQALRRGRRGAELARRVGASEAALVEWARGRKRPSGAARHRLADVLAIPVESWDEGAEVKPRAPRSVTTKPGPSLEELRPLVERVDAILDGELDARARRRAEMTRASLLLWSRRWRDALAALEAEAGP